MENGLRVEMKEIDLLLLSFDYKTQCWILDGELFTGRVNLLDGDYFFLKNGICHNPYGVGEVNYDMIYFFIEGKFIVRTHRTK